MEKEILVSEITVKMGQKEIKMTVEEAKKLQVALEKLFGKEVVKETKVIHEHTYDHWYTRPYYYTPTPKWDGIYTYCSTAKGTAINGQSTATKGYNAISIDLAKC